MESTFIYIAMHKPYQVPTDADYVPIQVGAAFRTPFLETRDNTGDHISNKNLAFCEQTALYWIWKNTTEETVGLVHYRRYFSNGRISLNPWNKIITGTEIREHMRHVALLLPKKRNYIIETTYSQYAHAHHEKDLLLCREVLSEQCPEYVHAFDAVMKRRSGHRFNMMIANRNVLDRYCGWLFPILFELERRIDVTGYDAYNRRVVGFLAERLLDVWLEKADVHFRELPVVNIERENWLRKGTCFILRKIKGGFRKKDRTS